MPGKPFFPLRGGVGGVVGGGGQVVCVSRSSPSRPAALMQCAARCPCAPPPREAVPFRGPDTRAPCGERSAAMPGAAAVPAHNLILRAAVPWARRALQTPATQDRIWAPFAWPADRTVALPISRPQSHREFRAPPRPGTPRLLGFKPGRCTAEGGGTPDGFEDPAKGGGLDRKRAVRAERRPATAGSRSAVGPR